MDTMWSSAEYMVLMRCGKPGQAGEIEFPYITEFNTGAVLDFIGVAASGLAEGILKEIGRAVESHERAVRRENAENRGVQGLQEIERNPKKRLEKREKGEYNALKRKSEDGFEARTRAGEI